MDKTSTGIILYDGEVVNFVSCMHLVWMIRKGCYIFLAGLPRRRMLKELVPANLIRQLDAEEWTQVGWAH